MELPPLNFGELKILGHGQDDIVQGIKQSLNILYQLTQTTNSNFQTIKTIAVLTKEVIIEIENIKKHLASLIRRYGANLNRTPEIFELAKRYCVLHAACACVQVWIYNKDLLRDYIARGEWLALCLNRLLSIFSPSRTLEVCFPDYIENAAQELLKLYKEDKLFSIIPLQLAQGKTSPLCSL
jgi:predicted nucleic-acid-binding protein